MIGRVLAGRYELGEILGQGGMAVVHGGLDRTLGREVAIKLLRPQYVSDPEFVERFEREARAAARLSHANVVDVFDVGSEGDTHFIVMELIEGENLKDLIRRAAPLPPARIITLGRELALALDYAHRRGLVHRDVKPQNVLLDPEGHARLTDFGIAQAAEQAGLTETGTVMGTAHYMSPEQASGQPAAPPSDLYSLGVVLYEMATGRVPFQADSSVAIVMQHLQAQPTPPRRLNPSIPPPLEAVILRALAKDPAARFASGAALAEALVEAPNPVAQRTAVQPAVRRPSDTARARAAAPTAVVAAVPGQARPPAPLPPRPRAPAQRRQSGGAGGMVILVLLILASLAFLALGFNWLFGASRPPATPPDPTPAPGQRPAPAVVATTSPTPQRTPTRPALTPSPGITPTPAATPATPTSTPTRPAATSVPPTATRVPPPPPTAPARPTAPAARVNVPRLVGLGLGEAQSQINSRGLTMAATEGYDPGKPNGVVLSQSPKEGEAILQGSQVDVVVNRLDQQTAVVPNVGGLDEPEARRILENMGFKVKRDRGQGQRGVIIDQSPEPGIRVPAGTEVTIVIGS